MPRSLPDILFLAEEYEEARNYYDEQAANQDRYLRLVGDDSIKAMHAICADVYMKARQRAEAVHWYTLAARREEESGKGTLLWPWCAFGLAILGEGNLSMEFFDQSLDRAKFLAGRSKGAHLVSKFAEVRRAELHFILRDLKACETSLRTGQEALNEVEAEKYAYFKQNLFDYQHIAAGIEAALRGARNTENAPALAAESVAHFEKVLSNWLRYNILDKDCYRFRFDTLIARGICGPAGQDEAYRRYRSTFNEELT